MLKYEFQWSYYFLRLHYNIPIGVWAASACLPRSEGIGRLDSNIRFVAGRMVKAWKNKGIVVIVRDWIQAGKSNTGEICPWVSVSWGFFFLSPQHRDSHSTPAGCSHCKWWGCHERLSQRERMEGMSGPPGLNKHGDGGTSPLCWSYCHVMQECPKLHTKALPLYICAWKLGVSYH